MEATIGSIIRRKRGEKGISQTRLATRIGRSPQLICDIESGRKKPSIDTLIAIAKELDISLDDIFFRK
ncbi:helix-turn-helix transcriptional regulator [Moorella sp. E306M]|uniref:helix-turn-helix transcriptional regulator n=1 Tax=Moorella sp. E306M TaxID=2572683 RepID=UPI0010FFAACE|nr:helix-turn-helix transcriptional regulator [Moorella sp. E306M]GEA17785.1 hypothetical protein E306M_09190 [Moorella sp. E306M]GEA17854.1 hypothetical protein E306M_09880 [Moorella sp. E306M]